jgi:hypothetical protein
MSLERLIKGTYFTKTKRSKGQFKEKATWLDKSKFWIHVTDSYQSNMQIMKHLQEMIGFLRSSFSPTPRTS